MTALIRYCAVLFVLLAVLAGVVSYRADKMEKASAYDRIEETGVIRCGYLPYEPFIVKDPNTGKLSGLLYDYINKVAEKAGKKVDWSAEITIDQIVPALDTGRIDMGCVPFTPDRNWSKVMDFSGIIGSLPYYVYVSDKDGATESELPSATFAVVDGYALTEITKMTFPAARTISLPQTTSTAEMYDQIRYGKARAHVNEAISANNYIRNNPGVIRQLSDKPVISMVMYLGNRKGDVRMKEFVSKTFFSLKHENLELMRGLMKAYDVPENAFFQKEECTSPRTNENGWAICSLK